MRNRRRLGDGVRVKRYRARPGSKVRLSQWNPDDTSGFDGKKDQGIKALAANAKKIDALQELLYAEHKHKVLVVLQGMDSAGKDATIRRVFDGVNPEGVKVAHFGRPSAEEAAHDYLWRAHRQSPETGEIMIFNRSHYESVLVERVHNLVPKKVWMKRFEQINDFERMLNEEGAKILKFFLYIDKDEQARRFQDRLKDPTKHWKFSYLDYNERTFWKQYQAAYEEAVERTSTEVAPWYVVPSNHAWFRDLVVSHVVLELLESLDMHYPKLDTVKAGMATEGKA